MAIMDKLGKEVFSSRECPAIKSESLSADECKERCAFYASCLAVSDTIRIYIEHGMVLQRFRTGEALEYLRDGWTKRDRNIIKDKEL